MRNIELFSRARLAVVASIFLGAMTACDSGVTGPGEAITIRPAALSLLPGTESLGEKGVNVNDSGYVVASHNYEAQSYLIRGSQKTDLGLCLVQDINNRGQVLCSTSIYENGVFTDLFVSSGLKGEASGMDEAGTVFGMLTSQNQIDDSLEYHAFYWRSGTIEVLPGNQLLSTGHIAAGSGVGQVRASLDEVPVLLGPSGYVFPGSNARFAKFMDINDSGNIVGFAGTTGAVWLKAAAGGYQSQLLDSRSSSATGISEANVIVGLGQGGAFVSRHGDYTVLSDVVAEPGWSFTGSPGISRNGTIAVYGTNADGRKGIVLIKLQ